MKNFNQIYEAVYKESAEELEIARKNAIKNIAIKVGIIIIIGIVFSLIIKSFMFIIFFLVIAILVGILSTNKNYSQLFKNKVIGKFVKEYSENLDYLPNRGIAPSAYIRGGFERFDRFFSNDAIIGTLEGGYPINMAEVHTEEKSKDEDGHTTYRTIFYGLFAEIDINKIIPTTIKIRKNSISLFSNKDKIEMDSGEFEKIFNVYADNKIIAMQLLTADIMQMFIDFKEKNKITPEITLYRNNLFIRFATGNVFEATMFKNALDFDSLKKNYDIINFTLEITDKIVKNIQETEI